MTGRNNLCNIMQHNLIFNYLKTKSTMIGTYFWAITYLFPFTKKPHPTRLQNRISINTLGVYQGAYCISLSCLTLFIYCYSLFFIIVSLV